MVDGVGAMKRLEMQKRECALWDAELDRLSEALGFAKQRYMDALTRRNEELKVLREMQDETT